MIAAFFVAYDKHRCKEYIHLFQRHPELDIGFVSNFCVFDANQIEVIAKAQKVARVIELLEASQ